MLLAVDDADLLDDASALLLAQLAVSPRVDLVATQRTGRPLHPALHTLLSHPETLQVVLDGLSDDEVHALAESVLGDPVDAALGIELSRCARGNALLATKALVHARERGAVVRRNGVWTTIGGLEPVLDMADVIREEPLAADTVSAGEVVALAEPVELAIAERLVAAAALADLERRGLVRVRQDGRRIVMHIDEVACAAAFRSCTPRTRRREPARSLAAELDRLGARRFGDPVRQARWLSEAADYAHPHVFLRAAHRALAVADAESAMRFAQTATSHTGAAEPQILLGQALALLGRATEAEEHLATAADMPLAAEETVDVALTRARNLYWGGGRADEAEHVLASAAERVPAGALRDRLTAVRAAILLFQERYDEALRLCEPILERDDLDDDVYVFVLPIAQVVWLIRGRVDRVLSTATAWLPAAVALGDTAWLTDLRVQSMVVHARAWAGDARAAVTEARQLLEEAVDRERAAVAGFWNHHLAWVAVLYVGEIAASHDAVEKALRITGTADVFFHRATTHALLAKAEALLGQTDRAEAELRAADRAYDPRAQTFRTTIDYCRLWVTRLRDDEPGALRLAWALAQRCRDVGDRLREATVLDSLARWGHASDVAGRLSELAEACNSPVIRDMARAAAAAQHNDPAGLVAAARALERTGWLLHAADHAAVAADRLKAHGQPEEFVEAAGFALSIYARTGSYQTPAAIALASHDPRRRLTPREREIAGLAASGRSNTEIADALHLDVRTVGNHLASASRRLDLRGAGNRALLLRLLDLFGQDGGR